MNSPPAKLTTRFRKLVGALRFDSDILRLNAITVLIFITMCTVTDGRFLSAANFESMGFMLPELALLSLAMMLTMLTGGIDLSVVATANLAGIIAAMILTSLMPEDAGTGTIALLLAAAVIAAFFTGAACGTVNGLLVAQFNIPAILATLGTMQLFTGVALVITDGKAITGLPPLVQVFGNGTLWGVPIPFLLLVTIVVIVWILVARTPLGLRLRLTGSNPVAALFSGIPTASTLVRTYLASGLLASVTGLLMIARTNSAKADYGSSYLLQAILVAVLGGVNPAGGSGSVRGVVLAVIALQLLASGFNMLHFSNFSKEFVWGLFLLLIMIVNYFAGRRGRE